MPDKNSKFQEYASKNLKILDWWNWTLLEKQRIKNCINQISVVRVWF